MQPTIAVISDIRLKTLLAELVQMPTLTDETETCKAAIDWIKYQVRDLPLQVHDFAHNGHSALVLTTRRTRHPKVMLHSHIDVSPASPESFKLTERDGRYYGRGVFDMKFATACYIDLLLEIGQDLTNYDLGVMITTDEETTGGLDGAKPLVAAGWGADIVINPDSIETGAGWAIQRAAKGTVKYRIVSQGVAGHGSRPWLYRNAINEIMDFLRELATRFPSEPCGDPEHGHTTLNVGRIEGGSIVNQVAGLAEAHIDLRFMPGQTLDDMDQIVREVMADYEHLSLSTFGADEPVSIELDDPQVMKIKAIIETVTGQSPKFTLSHGASESAFFADAGMTVLMYSPPGGGHHGATEWIDAAGVGQFARTLQAYLDVVARVSEDTPK